jgi:hypothetical protein
MSEISINILANLITVVVLLVLGWLFYVFFGRRKLMSFFGVEREKILRIYVGSVSNPNAPKGFVGFEEISEAKNLEGLFKSVIPGLADQPGLLKFLQVSDIQTTILPAAPNSKDVTLAHSLISLGCPWSNSASSLLEKELQSPVKCNWDPFSIQIPRLPPITAENQGIVVKICRGEKHYFYVAGKLEPTTAGCVRFLIQNWKLMRKKYGDKTSFYYLLEVKDDSMKGVVSIGNDELQIAE